MTDKLADVHFKGTWVSCDNVVVKFEVEVPNPSGYRTAPGFESLPQEMRSVLEDAVNDLLRKRRDDGSGDVPADC